MELFAHNRVAYENALVMMNETGKAAIIHPTGTGKSFIAFQLALDNPDKRICWLSPSEYIFRTQMENLAAANNGETPRNIQFYTYAKLPMLADAELEQIEPDYIILDEFHRCGAAVWGAGVRQVLELYPDVPLLGLSATNIRYLDNQRDMADELFDGNVASRITLGEALARGILNVPTYVLAMYSYEKSLEKAAARVRRAKSQATQDSADRVLQSLRRALEQAEGLEKIFQKHMQDPCGKYIVFCASKEHMDEMADNAQQWFSLVDGNPHIYKAYSEDPDTDFAFRSFKQDNSKHLKLLFCIDMLNEGIHIEDVAGVILIRPTISPIVYKQQIGRALSASKRTKPIIFDIVNNFENLYSIGAIEEEMEAAISYYRYLGDGEGPEIPKFQIIDEVGDCRKLFRQLDETLSASWDTMFECASRYYAVHGNLEVPSRYHTEEGYALGSWIQTQRRIRAGEVYGTLTETRVQLLDSIGMVWGSYRDLAWERGLQEARQYRAEHGDLKTTVDTVTESGFRLGAWICRLRNYHRAGIQRNYLTEARIRELDALDMIWDVPDYLWQRNYLAAMEYYLAHGNLNLPAKYISRDGVALGSWLRKLRSAYEAGTLSEQQIRDMDALGMVWTGKFDQQWETGFRHAQHYFRREGNLDVPTDYVAADGFRLGKWIRRQRDQVSKLTEERRLKLDTIGMVWDKGESWAVRYALAEAFFVSHGHLNVPVDYVADGVWLEKWLREQRRIRRGEIPGKTLSQEQITALDTLGFDWLTKRERVWQIQYEKVRDFYRLHGHLEIPGDTKEQKQLRRWLNDQRRYAREGKLSLNQMVQLAGAGVLHKEHILKHQEQQSHA